MASCLLDLRGKEESTARGERRLCVELGGLRGEGILSSGTPICRRGEQCLGDGGDDDRSGDGQARGDRGRGVFRQTIVGSILVRLEYWGCDDGDFGSLVIKDR